HADAQPAAGERRGDRAHATLEACATESLHRWIRAPRGAVSRLDRSPGMAARLPALGRALARGASLPGAGRTLRRGCRPDGARAARAGGARARLATARGRPGGGAAMIVAHGEPEKHGRMLLVAGAMLGVLALSAVRVGQLTLVEHYHLSALARRQHRERVRI